VDDLGRCDGLRLKLRRVQAGLRQTQLARELGIPVTLLGEWEDGHRPVPPRQGQELLAAIDRLSLGLVHEGGEHAPH
jgi:DNA-binding transcriptional regulator YiaG